MLQRAFASERFGVRSAQGLSGGVQAEEGRSLWVDRSGAPLLERFEDVSIAVIPERFNTPFAFVGSQGDRAFPGPVRVLSELAGPGRFWPPLAGGLFRALLPPCLLSPPDPADHLSARNSGGLLCG